MVYTKEQIDLMLRENPNDMVIISEIADYMVDNTKKYSIADLNKILSYLKRSIRIYYINVVANNA